MLYGPRGLLNLNRARRRRDAKGQILVLFTLAIIVLMACAAIVIDLGLLRSDSARLQNALDAGALAAAQKLPANSSNYNTVLSTGTSYAQANFPGLPTLDSSFRCIIGADQTTGQPRLVDMPTVCNVPANSAWVCTAVLCWAPCNPATRSTDVCNTVVLKDSVTRGYGFGRAVGVDSGSTGTMQAAACTGPCGPTQPLDAALIIDRTQSMSGLTDTLIAGANAVLQAYDPTLQHIALGLLGPSSLVEACSSGAMGRVLVDAPSAPAIAGSTTANVQSASNASAGATSLVINKPTSTASGNLLVAGISYSGGSNTTITPPTGWNLIRRTDNSTNIGMASYYKVAGGGEPTSYSWTLSSATRASGGIMRYTGVNTSDPINASAGNSGNITATPRNASSATMNTTVNNTAIVGFYAIGNRTTFSPPTVTPTRTERFDSQHANAAGPTIEGVTSTDTTAGNLAADSATPGANGQYVTQRIAINPPPFDSYNIAYPTTNPPYSDTFLRDNMARWIPVGLTGSTNADINEAYRNSDGSVNSSSLIARAIQCADENHNDLFMGTDQASPFDFATAYLKGNSAMAGHARSGVPTGIIFETDGTPQTQNYTCAQAQAAATKAKNAGIEVFTIGYFASNGPNQNCPDTSGTWAGKKVIQSLAAMATNSSTTSASACDANENTDGDHFYCTPDAANIVQIFRAAALALASGTRLVQLYPRPEVTSLSDSAGALAGGNSITITGRYLSEAYQVSFGSWNATSFTVLSDTSIRVTVPPATAAGTVHVVVSTPGGSSATVNADRYTYNP
jgi:hypothetical protein